MAVIHRYDFRLLAAGQALSWLGNGFQNVALAVAIVVGGGGPGVLGLVMASSVGALLLCTLFGGVWADRVQPQRVMVVSDLIRLVTVSGIAVMFGYEDYNVPLLCVLSAISSGAGAFFSPAFAALKPMVATAERLQATNATLTLLQTSASVLGPAAGGLTVAVFGAPTGFAVNAASYIASVLTVVFIKARVKRTPREGMLTELGAGWREFVGTTGLSLAYSPRPSTTSPTESSSYWFRWSPSRIWVAPARRASSRPPKVWAASSVRRSRCACDRGDMSARAGWPCC